MTNVLKIEKALDTLPVTLTGNTIYLLKTLGKLKIFATNLDGTEVLSMIEYQPILKIKNLSANYIVLAEDSLETLIRFTGANPLSVTIPLESLDIPIGACILISNNTTSTITIVPENGVVANTPSSLVIGVQFAKVTLIKITESEWDIEGNLNHV